MGTRSVIAKAEGDAWVKGRYCHWDGYPSNQLVQLAEIVKAKGGVDEALEVLLANTWSNLNPKITVLDNFDDDRFVVHPGVGKSNNQGDEPAEIAESWVLFDGDGWGTEWSYALSDAGVAVFDQGGPTEKWRTVGFIRWEDITPETATALEDSSVCL